ncbi:hypothetical protein AAHA92_30395 [Salvia divinorum]|uniref:DC1 domain-containing protein n=1 Tax=Salvia divinorum TaxID=28513 RepID=A0ABD1FQQ2_SALDI
MSDERMKSEVFLRHFLHPHPLILTVADVTGDDRPQCDVCRSDIFSGQTIYRCSHHNCSSDQITLHRECAEMPREISLSSHPQHALIQKQLPYRRIIRVAPMIIPPSCAVCTHMIEGGKGYSCSSSDSCDYHIHIRCAHSMDVVGEPSFTKHPSHPRHELTLLRRPEALLRCDACGVIHRGNSYICTVCPYCINESCAALPLALDCGHLHGHPLSLAYRLPLEYVKYRFKCDVCFKDLSPNNWVYHCGVCRYVAHINCATTTSPLIKNTTDLDPDVIVCPINDIAEEVIGPLVRKLGITAISNDDEIVKSKYKFHNPNHQLRLISSSLCEEKEDEDSCDEDEDDVDLNYPQRAPVLSTWARNIREFGQRYDGMTLHQHPVAYQLTNKLRCSICGIRKVYGTHGFQCDSHKCDFFVCFDLCGKYLRNEDHDIK